MVDFIQKLKDLIAGEEPTPPVPPVAPVAPAPDPIALPVAPVAVAPPAPVPPPAEPAPAPVPVATAKDTIIPPAGVVTSAAPTGEAMYMAMTPKELADLARQGRPRADEAHLREADYRDSSKRVPAAQQVAGAHLPVHAH